MECQTDRGENQTVAGGGGEKAPEPQDGDFKDVRIALNTIRQSIDMIQKSGVPVEAKEEDGEEFYEFIIRVPKRSAKQGG